MKKKRIVLHFPHKLIDKPIAYNLVKDYNLVFNILAKNPLLSTHLSHSINIPSPKLKNRYLFLIAA